MDRLLPWLKLACTAFHLRIEESYQIQLTQGRKITALARISDGGQGDGMLIFEDYDYIKEYLMPITEFGYGYSILEEPFAHEVFDLEQYREMFLDWGFDIEPAK
jgi:hypothetical protein